jgi:hypothetical protein
MTIYTNLFDTRGGTTLFNRCEVCNEKLHEDSDSPVCADCHETEEEE